MKLLTTIFIFLILLSKTFSQGFAIKGNVRDTFNKKPLYYATILVAKVNDSIMAGFTRADEHGLFEIKNLPANKYFVLVSQPGYADFRDTFTLTNEAVNMGNIILPIKSKLLEEVVVKQKIAAIRMKGDTLEYKADSFKVDANASVQELLKRLPGISVNSKGEITAQGQTVKKVLVDGEEFFSDDPAVVTQGLRADAVDKVQVFDKKSDQAAFTGIDDGEKNKTINLQLKDDKKRGYFGKLEFGHSFDKYYTGKALANVFRAKQKLAAYLTKDNTKYEGLDWEERRNYGEDLNSNTTITDDGGINIWGNGDEFNWGQGFPNSTTGGLHYSTKLKTDTHKIAATYQYNDLAVEGAEADFTQTLLADNIYNKSNTLKIFNSSKSRHKARLSYEWAIDSTSSLKVIVNAYKIKSNTYTNNTGNNKDNNDSLVNDNSRIVTNANDDDNFNSSVFWRKKFKKKGRSISVNTDFTAENKKGLGYLNAINNFYKTGSLNNITDQQKQNSEGKQKFAGKVVYTEPLWKNTFLELNYKYEINRNDAQRITRQKPNGSKDYTSIVDSLSNHFIFNTTAHTAGFNVKYQVKKFNFTIGSGYGNVEYKLNDVENINNRKVSFNNFLPNIRFEYKPKAQTNLSIGYNGNNNNPSLSQIQPYIDNINPLNVTVGNPDLQQEFKHTFDFRFSKYQVIKSKNMYIGGSYSFTDNAITASNWFDSKTGKDTTQYINTNGNYSFWAWCSYGFEMFESLNININFSPSISKYTNYVNGRENASRSGSYKLSIGSGYWGDKWFNYWFNLGPNFHYSTSSISNIETRYTTYDGNISTNFKFKKIKLYTDINSDINIYEKTGQFAQANDIYKVNIGVKKSLDKNENWQVRAAINDLFNTNNEINRNITSNYISQTTQQVIRRYFMLTLTYNFSKNGKPGTF